MTQDASGSKKGSQSGAPGSVLIGLLDKSFNTKGNRLFLFFFVASLVGVFYYRLEFMDLFHPYSSIFYNYDLHRDLY